MEGSQNREEIDQVLRILWSDVNEMISSINQIALQARPNSEVWTIAEEFEHMILSAAPIAKVLNLGPGKLQMSEIPPRTGLDYNGLLELYWLKLDSGKIKAPATFSAGNQLDDSPTQLYRWNSVGKGLSDGLQLWDEASLDREQVKHPLLGHLTLREMLFFTHFHSLHHLESIKIKAAELGSLN